MNDDTHSKAKPPPPSREERLAAALRANLNRRKQLARSKKSRDGREGEPLDEPGDTPREGS